jgi:lysophospholipase L1-like esterase
MTTLAAGSSVAVTLAAGYAIYASGGYGTMQVAPPSTSALFPITPAGASVGPFPLAVTVNLTATSAITYRTDADSVTPDFVTLAIDPLTGEGVGINGVGGGVIPINTGAMSGTQIFAAFGDSITANGVSVGAGFLRYAGIGYTSWLQALSMGRLWIPLAMESNASVPTVNYNKGITGQTTVDMLLRLTDITNLSPAPKFVTVMCGTNDLTLLPNDSAETIFARWVKIVGAFASKGITPIVFTLLPRSVWSGLTSPQILNARIVLLQLNAYIRAYAASRPNVILVDAWQQFVNFGSATSDPISGLTSDGLHPNDIGAYTLGAAAIQAVDKWLTPYNYGHFAGPADAYSATNNYGAFYDTSWSAGGGTLLTGVTASGAGTPLGWTASRGTGATSTATIAQRARADGINGNEALYTLTGLDTAVFRLYSSTPVNAIIPTSSFVSGDAFYGESEALFSGTGVNGNPDHYIQASDSSLFVNALYNGGTDVPGTYNVLLRTPLIIQTTTLKAFQMWSMDGVKNAGATTVIRRNHVMRKYNKSQANSVL